MFPDADGHPEPGHAPGVRRRRAQRPSTSRSGPAATSTTPTSPGTIQRDPGDQPEPGADRARSTRHADEGPAPLTVQFDASGSTDPNNDALQYAWDLDGDGAYDDSTAATPTPHLHAGRQRHRPPARDRPVRRSRTPRPIELDGRHAADGRRSPRPTTGSTLRRRRPCRFSGPRSTPDGTPVPDDATAVDDRPATTARRSSPTSCHVHHIQNYVGVRRGRVQLPGPRVPVVRHDDADAPTRRPGLRGKRVACGSTRRPSTLTFDSVPVRPDRRGRRRGVDDAVHAHGARRARRSASPRRRASYRDGHTYDFSSWSDGGAADAPVHGARGARHLHRHYTEAPCPIPPAWSAPGASTSRPATVAYDASGSRQPRHDLRRRRARPTGASARR